MGENTQKENWPLPQANCLIYSCGCFSQIHVISCLLIVFLQWNIVIYVGKDITHEIVEDLII